MKTSITGKEIGSTLEVLCVCLHQSSGSHTPAVLQIPGRFVKTQIAGLQPEFLTQ